MKLGISIKIDVSKILKERLFKGQKGTYIDLITFIDTSEKDQYDNNGFISQSVSKDEKAAGVQTPILGNCKIFYKDELNNQQGGFQERAQQQSNAADFQRQQPNHQQGGFQQQAPKLNPQEPVIDFDDDIPF